MASGQCVVQQGRGAGAHALENARSFGNGSGFSRRGGCGSAQIALQERACPRHERRAMPCKPRKAVRGQVGSYALRAESIRFCPEGVGVSLLTIWREAAARAVDAVCLTVDQRWVKDSWLLPFCKTSQACKAFAPNASRLSVMITRPNAPAAISSGRACPLIHWLPAPAASGPSRQPIPHNCAT